MLGESPDFSQEGVSVCVDQSATELTPPNSVSSIESGKPAACILPGYLIITPSFNNLHPRPLHPPLTIMAVYP